MLSRAVRRRLNPGPLNMLKETSSTDDESSCSDSIASEHDRVGAAPLSPSPAVLPWVGLAVWPLMLALPLLLTCTRRHHYAALFPRRWYALHDDGPPGSPADGGGAWEWEWAASVLDGGTGYGGARQLRHPLGLVLGIAAVAVGHAFLLVYVRLHHLELLGPTTPIQRRGPACYVYSTALRQHLSQPGGFLLLGLYLTVTWCGDLLPPSYYSFAGGIQYGRVLLCLVCQDAVQYAMHRLEHVAHPALYRLSHKPHHKFTNPKLFDAFDGSVPDTALMILLPLLVTAHIVRDCNVWTYMAFGSVYANWLTLIHSEASFPWEPFFRVCGLGTAADHHIHHKFFKYNFGHLFMWFDWLCGTYRSPCERWGKDFSEGV